MVRTLHQIFESLRLAIQSVVVNKVRTLLSLLGITIGIFAIISVFTVLDSLETSIRTSVNKIGTNIVYVGRWPWTPEEGAEYQWWKFVSRPNISNKEYNEFKDYFGNSVEAVALVTGFQVTVQRNNRSRANVEVIAATDDFDKIRDFELSSQSRYFTQSESTNGATVAILGYTIAEEMFDDIDDAVGSNVKINGHKFLIIGVAQKQGTGGLIGMTLDNNVIVPYFVAYKFINYARFDKDLIVKGRNDQSTADLKAEVASVMRRIRRLPPSADDNFAINDISSIMKQLDGLFSTLNIVGTIIGLFSILVGGFGVANIMFVSVKERTPQIGIQKALGARPSSILMQFTFEAMMLSLLGGIIGLGFIWAGSLVATYMFDFTVELTLMNILIGMVISTIIGAVAGIFPAYSASRMDPVRAISKN